MSPSRRRQAFVQARPRSEIVTAVAVSAAIVLGTALLVWLMRPGTVGVAGGGGLFNRQPRMTILVLLTAAVIAGLVLFVVRRRRPPRFGVRGSIAIGTSVTLVLAVVAGIFWPGGVIRHWPAAFKLPDTPDTLAPTSTPTTASKTTTTKSGSSTTAVTPTTVTPTTVKGG
jgi:magnesium-transporting ATPase (P-type)